VSVQAGKPHTSASHARSASSTSVRRPSRRASRSCPVRLHVIGTQKVLRGEIGAELGRDRDEALAQTLAQLAAAQDAGTGAESPPSVRRRPICARRQLRSGQPNPNGACFLTVTATDWLSSGVVDHYYVLLQARPIARVPGMQGQWKLLDSPKGAVGLVVFPPQRTYRAYQQAGAFAPPPWQDLFAEWNAQHSPPSHDQG
jgi:hypothetical protein